MEFRCRVGTMAGDVTEGVYIAESETRLKRDLEDKGLYLLEIKRGMGLALPAFGRPTRRRVSGREFLVFNQELATLLKAGMAVVQSLDILRARVIQPVFRSVIDDVYERVRAGASLSEAFEAHGDIFPGVYTASLFAGEKSGGLEQVLRRYVAYVKILSGVKRKTISALVYPAILLALSLIVVSIIVLKVVPEFASFYDNFGADLPLATRIIVAVSSILQTYLLLVVLALAGGGFAFWRWFQRPAQRIWFDRIVLTVPWVGQIVRKFTTSQMARTLGTLLGGGIPLVQALAISERAMANRYMARSLGEATQSVREGQSLAGAMGAKGAFPDVAIKMIEVGEATGALQDMLTSLADFFDEEIETNLGRFVTMVEPLLLVVMGLVIAGLLLTLYMPLFQLSAVVG